MSDNEEHSPGLIGPIFVVGLALLCFLVFTRVESAPLFDVSYGRIDDPLVLPDYAAPTQVTAQYDTMPSAQSGGQGGYILPHTGGQPAPGSPEYLAGYQKLALKTCTLLYYVQPKDTRRSIETLFMFPAGELAALNPILDAGPPSAGQILCLSNDPSFRQSRVEK